MKLSLYEQETIILYNQAEATAEVYTHDPRLLEKLRRLAEKYPDQIMKKDRQTFLVPKRLNQIFCGDLWCFPVLSARY